MHDCGEAVLLARNPAFARVINLGYEATGGRNVRAVVKLDEGFAIDESFNVQGRNGYKIAFGLIVGKR